MTRIGATLANRYTLEETLGRGASGNVYRARDKVLGIAVVVKVLHEGLAQAHDVLERFKRELLLARRLTHPGICKVFDLQSEGETQFLVMEFVEGETLTTLLKREGKLGVARALDYLHQAADAVGAAHAAGVVHRDLKPENLMLRPDGHVIVLDFGIATQEGLDRLTRPGYVLGSRKYMAPELWTGAAPSPQSDVWSLGVILYGALCGRLPYRADGPFGVLDAVKTDAPPSPSSLNLEVTRPIEDVIFRCLALDPGNRYPDARALARALQLEKERAFEPTSITPMPVMDSLPLGVGGPAADVPAPLSIDDGAPPGDAPAAVPEGEHGPPEIGQTTKVDGKPSSWAVFANDAVELSVPPDSNADAVADPGAAPVDDAAASAAPSTSSTSPSTPPPTTGATITQVWRNADLKQQGAHPAAPEPDPPGPSAPAKAAPVVDDLGPARVQRDDMATMRVRNIPADFLVEKQPKPRASKAIVGGLAAAVVVLAVVLVALLGGGDDETTTTTIEPPPTEDPPVVEPPPVPVDPPVVAAATDAGAATAPALDAGAAAASDDAGPGDWEFEDAPPDPTEAPEAVPTDPPSRPTAKPLSSEDAKARARAKRAADDVARTMRERGLLPGDVPSLDQERARARGHLRARRYDSAARSLDEALRIASSAKIDAALVARKLARFNRGYDAVKDEARRAELGKVAVDIGRAMAKSDHETANQKLNEALRRVR